MTYVRPMGGQEGISSPSCVPKQVWKLLARRLLEKRGRCAAERKFRLKSLTIGEHALTNVSDFTEDVPIYCEVNAVPAAHGYRIHFETNFFASPN